MSAHSLAEKQEPDPSPFARFSFEALADLAVMFLPFVVGVDSCAIDTSYAVLLHERKIRPN